MKRPSLQFYPDNWRNNANLRRCSWAARGVWIEVMCLMHDSDRYGVLEWPLKEIAQALGCTLAPLKELVDKGVLKGCDKGECEPFIYVPRSGRKDGAPVTLIDTQAGPVWFSSRMLKDEYKRIVRGEGEGNGAAPKVSPKASPKGGFGAPLNPDIGPYAGAPPPSSPSPTSVTAGAVTARESPGEACKAMRQAGLIEVNPSHPTLLALLGAGVTIDELRSAAEAAVKAGKGYAYALATARGRRADAAQTVVAGKSDPDDWTRYAQ